MELSLISPVLTLATLLIVFFVIFRGEGNIEKRIDDRDRADTTETRNRRPDGNRADT